MPWNDRLWQAQRALLVASEKHAWGSSIALPSCSIVDAHARDPFLADASTQSPQPDLTHFQN